MVQIAKRLLRPHATRVAAALRRWAIDRETEAWGMRCDAADVERVNATSLLARRWRERADQRTTVAQFVNRVSRSIGRWAA